MRIKLELDNEMTEKLVQAAVREQRPAAWQAEVMLRRALGLPFPIPEIPRPQRTQQRKNATKQKVQEETS
jgi:hypothetical protein